MMDSKTLPEPTPKLVDLNTEIIFRSLPGLYLLLKPDSPQFTVLFASTAYLENTHTTRQAIVGKGIGDITPHNPKDRHHDGYQALMASLNIALTHKIPDVMPDQKFDVRLPDGSLEERYWRSTHIPVLSANEVQYIIHSVADVTGEVQSALAEKQYLDALATKDVQIGVLILRGPKYIVEYINPVICDLWDKTHDEAINRPLMEVLPTLAGQGFEQLLEGVLTTGIPYIGNEVPAKLLRHGRKETAYVDFVYNPLRDGTGHISGIMVIATESTQRVEEGRKVIEERKRLYEVFMQAPISIAIFKGPDNVVELANPDVCILWGKTHEQVIGKKLLDAIPEVAGQGFDQLLDTVRITGKPYVGNEIPVDLIRHNKPEHIFVNFVYAPLREASGEISGVMATAMEVTQQVQIRLDAQANEERFRTLIEHSTDAVQMIDAEGKITYSSESVVNVLGYSPEELLGKTVEPYIHPDDFEYFSTKARELADNPGERIHLEYRVKHKRGDWIWLETTAVNRLHDPVIQALVGNFRDITERKLLERQKDDFIGIATHELKTPVTSIKTYAQLLERRFKKSGNSDAQAKMAKINAQINKLTDLISDLLDITKIESGQLQLHITQFDFDELVKDITDSMQLTSERHQLVIEGSTGMKVSSDKDRLEQVLVNLIGNAIKYSPHSDKVEILLSSLAGKVKVSVHDYGVGIDKKRQAHVFERFYRVSGPNLNSFPGLGLGLYISSEIIKRLGGRIWVESAGKSSGSTFNFEIAQLASAGDIRSPEVVREELKHE